MARISVIYANETSREISFYANPKDATEFASYGQLSDPDKKKHSTYWKLKVDSWHEFSEVVSSMRAKENS